MRNGLEIDDFGIMRWFSNGILHRIEGPAVIYPDGEQSWYINGKLHREDGPAMMFNNDRSYWYYHGNEIDCSSQEEFERLLKLKAFW
jgi:hypothetical protein